MAAAASVVSDADLRFTDYCLECTKIRADYSAHVNAAFADRTFRALLDQSIDVLKNNQTVTEFLGLWADYVDEKVLAPAGYSPSVRTQYWIALATNLPFRLERRRAVPNMAFFNRDFKTPGLNNQETIATFRRFVFGVFRVILFIPEVTSENVWIVPDTDLLHCAIYGFYSAYRESDVTHTQFMEYVRSCVEKSKPKPIEPPTQVYDMINDQKEHVPSVPVSRTVTRVMSMSDSDKLLQELDGGEEEDEELKRLQGIDKIRQENEYYDMQNTVFVVPPLDCLLRRIPCDDDDRVSSEETVAQDYVPTPPPPIDVSSSALTVPQHLNGLDICGLCGKGDFGQCTCDRL